MSIEQNKALANQLIEEILNKRNVNLIDELFSPNFVENEELPPGIPPGREAPKALFGMLHSAFPDFNASIEQMIAEGDKVVIRMTWSGTHKGEFMGIPPTGRNVSFGVIDIVRLAGGKFMEHWGILDNMAMMQQLGVIPGPGEG